MNRFVNIGIIIGVSVLSGFLIGYFSSSPSSIPVSGGAWNIRFAWNQTLINYNNLVAKVVSCIGIRQDCGPAGKFIEADIIKNDQFITLQYFASRTPILVDVYNSTNPNNPGFIIIGAYLFVVPVSPVVSYIRTNLVLNDYVDPLTSILSHCFLGVPCP